MHISALQIQGFGQLSEFLMEGLTPGLNVIFGPNGSGKSTLLQFVRGVLLGFHETRQLGLLPPRDFPSTVRRQAGGSIELLDNNIKIGIVRTASSDQQDHLAVRVQEGVELDAQHYRSRLQQLTPEVVQLLFAVGTSEAHSMERLLKLADRDGLHLLPTISESPEHHARLQEIRRRRSQLTGDAADATGGTERTLLRLDRQRRQMQESLEAARQSVIARYRALLNRELECVAALEVANASLEQADLELQASQADLRAAEEALQTNCDEDQSLRHVHAGPAESDTDRSLNLPRDIEEKIVRARQVLLDLAGVRHELSCQIAQQLVALESSICSRNAESPQETRADRDQIDRCEIEVTLYLQQLLRHADARANALTLSQTTTTADVLSMTAELHRAQIVANDDTLSSLREDVACNWAKHQAVSAQWCAAAESLRRVKLERRALAADDGLDVLRFQLQVLDQEWRQIHEDWQALLLAETALTRANTPQRVETPSELISRASQCFQRLTQGRYRELRFNAESYSLSAVSPLSEVLNVSMLSRGTLDQAALSLRLAMLEGYAGRGVTWPILLDEVLVDSDLERLRLAAEVLQDFAQQFGQVIYLTCLEHLVEVMQSIGANIVVMPGHQRQWRRDASQAVSGPHWLSPREESHLTQERIRSTRSKLMEATEDPVPKNASTQINSEGCWLCSDSPVSLIPSLGPQMATRLVSAGIRNVGELVAFDPLSNAIDWPQMQVSNQQFRIWQAEACLLCSVPRLTGRDAQRLVAVGILNLSHLAEESPDRLMRRIDRLRGTNLDHESIDAWPHHAELVRWIAAARASETMTSKDQVDIQSDTQFYLDLASPIIDAPSIGPTTARKLSRIGIHTVGEFLNRDPVVVAQRLDERRISAETVLTWQQQAGLMVRIPGLRGHDAQVLVACGIVEPEALSRTLPESLFAKVAPFVATHEGRRLLRSAKVPDLNEVSDWINWARHARTLRAA